MSPEVWTQVDAARVVLRAGESTTAARELRVDLALALADAVLDGRDVAVLRGEYARACAAHLYAATCERAALDELHAARVAAGIVVETSPAGTGPVERSA